MMKFEQACVAFNVPPTNRQRRRWNAGQGRAFRLASYFSDIIEQRKRDNDDVREVLDELIEARDAAKKALAKAKKNKKATKPIKKVIERLEPRISNLRADIVNVIPDANEIRAYLNRFSRERMAS